MITRIYALTPKNDGAKPRLVDTTSPAKAMAHVSQELYSVKAAGAREVAEMMAAGVALEKADAEPATQGETQGEPQGDE